MAVEGDYLDRLLLQILPVVRAGARIICVLLAITAAIGMAWGWPPETANTPSKSWVMDATTEERVKAMLAETPAPHIGGIWSATADGAKVAIISGTPPGLNGNRDMSYLIVALRTPRPAIAPGTVMGWCVASAKAGFYDCTLFTRCHGSELTEPKRFTLRLNDDARLSLIKVRDGLEIVAWKIIPYMFRSFIRERHDRPRDLDGLIRLWPDNTGTPPSPRYL